MNSYYAGVFVIIMMGLVSFTSNQVYGNQIISFGVFGDTPSMAIGNDGFPVIVYRGINGINFLRCSSQDCSTIDPETPLSLDSLGANFDAAVTIGTDTFPVVSYYDGTTGEVKLIHCLSIDCTNKDPPVVFDSVGTGGPFPHISVSIGIDSFPVIVYNDRIKFDIKFVHCTTVSCLANNSTAFDAPIIINLPGSEFGPSMVIGSDTFPIISNSGAGLLPPVKVHHCTTIDCTGSIFHRDVIGLAFPPSDTSIVVGTDTFPTIIYHESVNNELQLIHCTSVDCSTNDEITILDSKDKVGEHNSMTIGIDGYPIISYQDLTNHSLKVVHCKNISCSMFDEPVVLDSISSGVISTSISITPDGLPVIAYNLSTSGLKLVKCSAVSCNPSHSPPCNVPDFETWTITSSCRLINSDTAPHDVHVTSNSVLTIPNGITLDIDFLNNHLLIKSGSSVIIENGGTVT